MILCNTPTIINSSPMKQFYFLLTILLLIHCQVFGQSVPTYVPTNGLVGWWPFNGNAQDGSGNGNHGTVNGATLTTDRFGNQNGAYSFDGVDDKLTYNNTFIFHGSGERTISFWFNCSNTSAPYSTLFFSRLTPGETDRFNFYLYPPNGGSNVFDLRIDYRESNITQHVLNYTTNSFLNTNNWYNVVITRSSNTYKLYVNGNFYNEIQDNSPNLPNGPGWQIGIQPNYPYYYSGKIDEIGTWNRALTQQEITNLYNAQSCQVSITSQPVSQTVGANRNVQFSVVSSDSISTYRWQSNSGFGFQDLYNAGQYSGVNTSTLHVSNNSPQNDNQLFRCIVSTQNCGSDTSDVVTLNVNSSTNSTGVPNKFTYQSVIRDSSGQLMTNHAMGVRMSLQRGPHMTNLYTETHQLSTNSNGLLTTIIGSGQSTLGRMDTIDWSVGMVYVKTEIDLNGGSNYSLVSTRELLSVPYALYSLNSGSSTPGPVGPQGPQGVPGPQGPAGGPMPSGGSHGQVLVNCNGILAWGGCTPLVTTSPITYLSGGTPTTGGVVSSDGGSVVTARGVVYGTSSSPTLSNSFTTNGTGTGSFTSELSGLATLTTYYVRAYATNSVGTGYGNEVSFTTTSSNSLQNGLIAWWPFNSNTNDESGNGNHGVNNGAVLTTDRFNSSNSAYILTGSTQHINLGNILPSGNSTISFWFSPTSSTLNRNQFLVTKRSSCLGGSEDYFDFAINLSTNKFSSGWGNGGGYLQPISFLPNQWNQAVIIRDADSMVFYLNGVLLQKVFGIPRNNNVPIRISGNFCQFGSPDWYDGKIDDIGIWNRALSALDVIQLYNSNSSLSFSLPTVTTISATSVTTTSATMGGNVTSDGGASVTARGVAYGMAQNPTISGTITSNGTGTGVFTSALTGLTASTLYYARAYATNSVGTAYGNEVIFTTNPVIIGSNHAGGIVFYVDGTGQHGLVCAPNDQGFYEWGCHGTNINGTLTLLGTGRANTNQILSGCSTRPIAASICDNLVLNGYSDWYLPSINEAQLMYSNLFLQNIGGFTNGVRYWSSSQVNTNHAWGLNFANGNMDNFVNKFDNGVQVRAIRTF